MRLDHSHQRISLFGKIIKESLDLKEKTEGDVKEVEKKQPHIVKTHIADSDDEGEIL